MSSHQHGFLHETLHHAALALVVASLVFLLEMAGALHWLDSVSLRLANEFNREALLAAAGQPEPDDPRVVGISAAQYETLFGQQSPLPRAPLVDLLAPLLDARPARVVIDLDLSPGGMDDAAQASLDELLAQAAGNGVDLVLATPVPVATDDLYARKYAWMRGLCAAGVRFGYPWVPLSQGVALRFTTLPGVLVDVAHRHGTQPGDPCALVGEGPARAVFLSADFPLALHAAQRTAELPLPMPVLARIDRAQSAGVVADAAALAGRTVFVGGVYDGHDRFPTVYGEVSGLVLHAAAWRAISQQTAVVSHGWAFLVDLVIGVLAGFLFHLTWRAHAVANRRLVAAPRNFRRHYLVARLTVLGNLLALGGTVALVFSWSGWLLEHNLWNNPGPMLVGVFIKMAVASRGNEVAGPSLEKAGRIDLLLFAPAVLLALYLLLAGHH